MCCVLNANAVVSWNWGHGNTSGAAFHSLAQSATAAACSWFLSLPISHRVRNPRAPTPKASIVDPKHWEQTQYIWSVFQKVSKHYYNAVNIIILLTEFASKLLHLGLLNNELAPKKWILISVINNDFNLYTKISAVQLQNSKFFYMYELCGVKIAIFN